MNPTFGPRALRVLAVCALSSCVRMGSEQDSGVDSGDVADGSLAFLDVRPTDAPSPVECRPEGPPASGHHVALTGSPSGDGTAERPWDLATALRPPPSVRPGDTIWLHGGTYHGMFVSRLQGTPEAPVVVRSYPREWAVLDGDTGTDSTLQVYRGDAVYRDFEITNSLANRAVARRSALWLQGARIRLVNLQIHDTGNVPMYEEAPDLEVYGCLIYNVGYDATDRAHGHNLYIQNDTGTKTVEDNVIFNGFSLGIHAYAEGGSHLRHMRFAGNVLFGAGVSAAGTGTLVDNLLVGGTAEAADDIVVEDNLAYAATPTTRSVRFGYGVANGGLVLRRNYLVGETTFARPWSSVTMQGNTFVGPVNGMIDRAAFPENTFHATSPMSAHVVVRPNRYEPGRALIAAYNPGLAEFVTADVASVIAPSGRFEVRNAQNIQGPPVASGTFDGAPLRLPTMGLDVVQPIGSPSAIADSERTGRAFNVYVLRAMPCP